MTKVEEIEQAIDQLILISSCQRRCPALAVESGDDLVWRLYVRQKPRSKMDVVTHIKPRGSSSVSGLFWLLAGTIAFAALIVAADSRGWLDILGWRKSPGVVLVSGLFLLAVMLLRLRFQVCRTLWVVALFGSSIVIGDRTWVIPDFVRLPVWFWLLAAISAPLIGAFFIYQMRVALALQAAFAVLGGYIQAVHIYNTLHPGEHMGFFGPSWIS